MQRVAIYKDTSTQVIASQVQHANRLWSRLRGLLVRSALQPQEGLLLTPCNSIHTFFMRYNIDVIFLDGNGVVVKCVAGIKPWRWAGSYKARHALELAAGAISRCSIAKGDKLKWRLQ